MAGSGQVWEVRTTGNDLNGGGFDVTQTSPGTDYSQQNGAQVTFNGTTITASIGAAGATITITGYTVAAGDVGNTLNLISGTGSWTAGWYTIISVNTGAGTWTLDRNVATGISSAMTGRMGGALASVSKACSVIQASGGTTASTGQLVWVKAGTYSQSSTINLNQVVGFTVMSYTSTRGDGGQSTITTATNSTILFSSNSADKDLIGFVNFIFTNTAGTPAACFAWTSSHFINQALFVNCTWSGFTNAIDLSTNNPAILKMMLRGCKMSGLTDCGIKIGGSSSLLLRSAFVLMGCLIETCTNNGILVTNPMSSLTLWRTVVYNCGSHGIWIDSDTGNFDTQLVLLESAVTSNGGDNIKLGSGGTHFGKILGMVNSAIIDATAWGVDFESSTAAALMMIIGYANAYYNNASGNINNASVTAPGQVLLTGDPFTNQSGLDFTLNNTAGAGAACKAVGYPTAIPGG